MRNLLDCSFLDTSCESVASSNNLSLCFDDDFEDTKSELRELLKNIDIDLLHGDALHLREGILTHLTEETARDLLVVHLPHHPLLLSRTQAVKVSTRCTFVKDYLRTT